MKEKLVHLNEYVYSTNPIMDRIKSGVFAIDDTITIGYLKLPLTNEVIKYDLYGEKLTKLKESHTGIGNPNEMLIIVETFVPQSQITRDIGCSRLYYGYKPILSSHHELLKEYEEYIESKGYLIATDTILKEQYESSILLADTKFARDFMYKANLELSQATENKTAKDINEEMEQRILSSHARGDIKPPYLDYAGLHKTYMGKDINE